MKSLFPFAFLALMAVAPTSAQQNAPAGAQAPANPHSAEQILPLVKQYCGAGHAVPRPDILPRRSWPAVIRTMVEIAQRRTGRAGLSEAQMNDITALYYGSAPE